MIDVIVNPVAGNGRGLRIGKKIVETLVGHGVAHRVFHTEYPGHATILAKECAARETDTVLSVGGDGTAYEIASGLIHTKTALGLIPAGTGNDFIKSIGIPRAPLNALEYILVHPPQLVDMGRMNGQMFLNVCGTGFDVSVLEYANKAKKLVRGLLPYLYGVIRTILHFKPVPMRVIIDEETEVSGAFLQCSVANGRYIGGGIPISPTASVNDGLLDVVILRAIPNWKMFFYLPGLLLGYVHSFGITTHYRCSQVCIDAPGMHLNVDGEIIPMSQVDFSILKKALWVHW